VRECEGHIQVFRLAVPTALPGVPTILNPVNTWKDKDEFDKTARAGRPVPEEIAKFEAQVDADVRAAAPTCGLRQSDARRRFRNGKK